MERAGERTREPRRSGRGTWPERAVLAGGIASCAALLVAAAVSLRDPHGAGTARLARLAGEVADGVAREWQRLVRDPGGLQVLGGSAAGQPLAWCDAPWPEPAAAALPAHDEVGHRAFDVLLAEAERLERAGEPREALALAREALARDADPPRRAEGRLRVIQLAVAAGRDDLAREAWRAASAELAGDEAREDVSYLLLCALAAAPALEEPERRAAGERLLAAWSAGELALPPLEPPAPGAGADAADAGRVALFLRSPSPLRAALRRRVGELAGRPADAPDPWPLRERAAALAALLGAVPQAPPAGETGFVERPGWVLALRRGPEAEGAAQGGVHLGVVLPPDALAQRLEHAARGNGLLPAGFALDFDGGDASLGAPVRERTALLPGLGFVLRHADPEALIAAEEGRLVLLRVALVALGLFLLAAGGATFRALRRERRLGELRSAFVAGVSHELRTPLASILLLAEGLEENRPAGEAARARYVGAIRREAERLRRLVEDVLDLSRLERGEPPALRASEVDARALARRLEDEARERVAQGGGQLAFETNGIPERAWLDEAAVRRALLNLVDNALAHSGSREVAVRLGGDGAGGLRLAVRDRGRGVPPGARARIFEPFERLGSVAPGAGLGLAIVRQVARAHGGEVAARSPEEGPGTLFELHLPCPPRPDGRRGGEA